jgi:two-component system response regulator HydG
MAEAVILVIEDDPDGCRSVTEAIEDVGFEVVAAQTGEEGLQRFRERPFDAVLSDLVLPDIDGVEVLNRIRRLSGQVPVLIMTAYGSVPSAVDALKSGAYDYVTKPLDLNDLQSKVARAVETGRLRQEVAELQDSLRARYSARRMVAASPAMRELVGQIEVLADAAATVLILGESGTGKELVARALHADGRRRRQPFVAVNCGAFAETLLESELFGHEKGAFTGATGLRRGAFERAHGGTLFLDEIGNAPSAVQVKLLRIIEEREVVRVGGSTAVPVDVRLISASNRDLDEMVAAGEFREDLLYRLKVVTLRIPPLRERREDIRPLADRFLALACEEHGRTITSVDPGVYDLLERQEWPGNVRQLRNAIEAAVVMAVKPQLQAANLRLDDVGLPRKEAGAAQLAVPDGMTLEEVEKQVLLQMLTTYEGNRTLVAGKLGISRRTIQRKIRDYGLPF